MLRKLFQGVITFLSLGYRLFAMRRCACKNNDILRVLPVRFRQAVGSPRGSASVNLAGEQSSAESASTLTFFSVPSITRLLWSEWYACQLSVSSRDSRHRFFGCCEQRSDSPSDLRTNYASRSIAHLLAHRIAVQPSHACFLKPIASYSIGSTRSDLGSEGQVTFRCITTRNSQSAASIVPLTICGKEFSLRLFDPRLGGYNSKQTSQGYELSFDR